nr:hypothetical protein [uncultured Lachnoclostridium sp.]
MESGSPTVQIGTARSGKVAYGKFFNKKAEYRSKKIMDLFGERNTDRTKESRL